MCLFSFYAYDRSHMKSVVLPPSLKKLLPPQIHELCTGAFYKRNERLFLTGKIPQWMFYVIAGEVTLERTGLQGEPVVLQRTRLGFVSEASLKVAKYHCDALAIMDSNVIKVPAKELAAVRPLLLPQIAQKVQPRGCQIFCVNGVRLLLRHSFLKLNTKLI